MSTNSIGRREEEILLELAVFYETNGLTHPTTEEHIQERLKEFRSRIENGGVTLEDLAMMVYKMYGKKPTPSTSDDTHG